MARSLFTKKNTPAKLVMIAPDQGDVRFEIEQHRADKANVDIYLEGNEKIYLDRAHAEELRNWLSELLGAWPPPPGMDH